MNSQHALVQKTELLIDNIAANKYQIFFNQENIFNPSVARLDDKKIFVARRSSLKTISGGLGYEFSGPPNTDNILFTCDSENNLLSTVVLNDSVTRGLTGIADCGLEDIRLFVKNRSLFGICAGLSFPNGIYRPKQIIVEIKGGVIDNAVWLNSPNNSSHEKNWAPLVLDNNLYLFYGLDPLGCLEIKKEGMLLKKGVLANSGEIKLRGGTPFININSKYLCVGHYQPIFLDKRYYRHCFVLLDNEFNLIEISKPFFIQHRGLEFAAGLCISGEVITLSYGVSDKEAHYLDFNIADLYKYLQYL